VNQTVVEGRNVAVLLGAEPPEPGLARVNDEDLDARAHAAIHQSEKALLRVLVVHPDPALDRGWDAHGGADRPHALGHQLGLAHETSAEAARLHPVRRTTDV
jgi:hypothetical protein